jgi:hypothetical protein
VYPKDVGVSINQYPVLTLQIHYNNPALVPGADASGVGYCTTTAAKQNVAGIVTFGTDLGISIPANANGQTPGGTGTCNNMFRANPSFLPVGFGIGTASEMCYDFLIAYPPAQLRPGCGALILTFNQ